MILATITLTFTLNNVILLLNFLSMITIVGIELSVSNIEINLLILVIYESSLLCLFLVNGILLMSSLTFNFRISVNNLLIIPSFHSVFPSVFLFQSIHYFDSNSSLFLYFPFLFNASVLTFGFERVGNLLFDNSLFPLIVLIFLVSIVNILILFFNAGIDLIGNQVNYGLFLVVFMISINILLLDYWIFYNGLIVFDGLANCFNSFLFFYLILLDHFYSNSLL